MKIAVLAGEQQKDVFISKEIPAGTSIHWLQPGENVSADVYFDLIGEDQDISLWKEVNDKPVFTNAVIITGASLPLNAIRINTWPGFLNGNMLEVSGPGVEKGIQVLQQLGWAYTIAPDTPGMIAARVVAMIINEAYYGVGEEISSKKEIDTAMKLGTNYPFGPFEWSEKIGLQKIHRLLEQLGQNNTRYTIAPKLMEESKILSGK